MYKHLLAFRSNPLCSCGTNATILTVFFVSGTHFQVWWHRCRDSCSCCKAGTAHTNDPHFYGQPSNFSHESAAAGHSHERCCQHRASNHSWAAV